VRAALLIALVTLTACHGPLDVSNEASYQDMPFWLSDHQPQLVERTSTTADAAARVWGGSPDYLKGWTVRLVGGRIQTCGGHPLAGLGCAEPAILGGGAVRVFPEYAPCIEATILAHEVGHIIIGDDRHTDPRWCDEAFWTGVAETLAGEVAPVDAQCAATLRIPGWLFGFSRVCDHLFGGQVGARSISSRTFEL